MDQLTRPLALCAITLAFAGAALAQSPAAPTQSPERMFISPAGEPFRPSPDGPPPFEVWWSHLDPTHSGRADRAAFRADAVAFFERLDVNHDGVVDGFEVAAYEKSIAPELAVDGQGMGSRGATRDGPVQLLADPEPVSGADLDLTSKITLAEWLAATDRRFDMLDKKRQGFLDHDALLAMLPKAGRERRR
jgi:hypothetical protein